MERMMMLAPPKVQTMVRLLMVPHTGKAGQLITSSMGQPMEQSMAQRKGQQRAQQKGKKTDTESWREGGVWSSRVEARIQRRRAPRPTMMTSAEDLCWFSSWDEVGWDVLGRRGTGAPHSTRTPTPLE
jgi:hypothetical protein